MVCAEAFELVEVLECWFTLTKIVFFFVISTRRRISFSLLYTILLTNCCWVSFYSLLAVQNFDEHCTFCASTCISFFLKQLNLSAEWVCSKHFYFPKFLSWQDVLLGTLRNFNWCFLYTEFTKQVELAWWNHKLVPDLISSPLSVKSFNVLSPFRLWVFSPHQDLMLTCSPGKRRNLICGLLVFFVTTQFLC